MKVEGQAVVVQLVRACLRMCLVSLASGVYEREIARDVMPFLDRHSPRTPSGIQSLPW